MQEKQTELFFMEFLVIVIILGFLLVIAVPHVGQMINQSRMMSRETELQDIQVAVKHMLDDSAAGKLESVGPTADISRVHTWDMPPLVLKDYLKGREETSSEPGCTYGFAVDGTVIQFVCQ
jgi:hypothetical protein